MPPALITSPPADREKQGLRIYISSVLGAGPLPLVAAFSKRWDWRQRGVEAWNLKLASQWILYNFNFSAAYDCQRGTNNFAYLSTAKPMGDRFTCLEKANGAASKRKQRKNEKYIEARALTHRFCGNLLAQCEAIHQIARQELRVG